MSAAVLCVEDAPDDAELLLRKLRRGGLEVEWRRVETEPALREALAAACGQMAAWVAQGLESGRMAVNLSARQFRQQDLAEEVVQRTLAESGLPPRMLELEITESLAMDDVAFTREALATRASWACTARSTASAPATRRSAT